MPEIDNTKAFQFLYMQDCGPCDPGCGSGQCPHCGADGRYIYYWAEYGKVRGAMAGCYNALTGRVKKDDIDTFMTVLATKLAKGKPLNGWQKTVLRMQQFITDGKYPAEWCNQKIKEAVADQRQYAFRKGR
jgi:hypothetical protein